jgi:hypothetical protein
MSASHQYAGISANMTIKTVDDWVFDSYDACDRFATKLGRKSLREGGDWRMWVIASNVYLIADTPAGKAPSKYVIMLYETEIVHYYPDGTFSVANGGHATPTTATRVTQFTPAGYAAHHSSFQMILNGHATGHNHRFPVERKR